MGSSISSLFGGFVDRKEYRISILGLEATGKTSLLYRLTTGAFKQYDPTTSYIIEKLKFKNKAISFADMAGEEKYRWLWRHYYCTADGIIFVIDATNEEQILSAADTFKHILPTFNTEHVLILANKQDLGNCVDEDKIINIFGLRESSNLNWRVQPASVKECHGVNEGFEWLVKEISK